MPEEVGALAQALAIFKVFIFNVLMITVDYLLNLGSQKDHKVNLMHIESRSSKRSPGDYEFMVEIDREKGDVNGAFDELRKKSAYFQIITRNHNGKNAEGTFLSNSSPKELLLY